MGVGDDAEPEHGQEDALRPRERLDPTATIELPDGKEVERLITAPVCVMPAKIGLPVALNRR